MKPTSEAYNMNCMDYMRDIPDKFFELAIVDPPYGLDKSSTQGSGKLKNRCLNLGNIHQWDIPPDSGYFKELFRVSKNQVIWGGNYFNLPPARGIICWDKMQPWENFSQIELAWTSFDCPAAIFRLSNTGLPGKETKIHPTQKPVALYQYLLKKFAKPHDKILDTHLGSGSSRIAAYMMGFDFHACEINSVYFNAQNERFERECLGKYRLASGKTVRQMTIFDL